MKQITNKTIAFNATDPAQKELLDYAARRTTNFSSFMKRLLAKEMEREGGGTYVKRK